MLCDALEGMKKCGVVDYVRPLGGYFASAFLKKGTAKRTVELCKKCGVTLTPAGSTYPYGKDPDDSNLRLAPTFATLDELKMALEIFECCVRLTHVEALIKE
jgi:DNA-binding transcriptional MocR family regulator